MQYDGPDRQFVDPIPEGILKYNIKINTPGTYQFIWRTGYGLNSTTFDGANDTRTFELRSFAPGTFTGNVSVGVISLLVLSQEALRLL